MENYTQHITRTRIAIPRKRADLISRQRLLDALDELLDKKVIIIAAPAGYGKTSLLIDLADDLALPVCWYSLDALDQNISRFLEYFVASIQVKFPEFKTNIINILHSSYQKEIDIDAIVTMLVNDIYDQITEHFIIMLDDYHLVVEDTQINQFLSRFLQNVEENCHIVFASRTLLALPDLPLMVARGLVGGLGFEELAFTTGETRELFFSNHHIVLSDSEAENLCKQTEGWITGLLLTAQTSISRLQAHEKSLRATGVNINDYFELIYNAQPEHIQQFLLYTSLLEDFDFDSFNQTVGKLFPELCKQYKTCADHIFKANLFVQSVGLDGLSLRYHHLFLDYLQQKVRLEQTETYEKLQEIIANHYRQTQQWEKAYEIYKKDGYLKKQIALLEEASVSMMFAGLVGILYRWLQEIPDEILNDSASLCSVMGIVLSGKSELNSSLEYLNRALEKIDGQNNPALVARTLVRKASTLRTLGKHSEALDVANQSLLLVQNDINQRSIRAEANRTIGGCFIEMGNPTKSLEYFSLALEDFKFINQDDEIAITTLNISTANSMLGQFETAKKNLYEVINYWEKNGNQVWLANALNNLGYLLHLMGDLENAVINLEKAIHYCRILKYSRLEAITLCSIADIYTDLGALDEANNLYMESLNIGRNIESNYVIIYCLYSLSIISIFTNRFEDAKELISELKILVRQNQTEFYLGLENFVEGLYLYSINDFHSSISSFTKAHEYFFENQQNTYTGKIALYLLFTHFSLENENEVKKTYGILCQHLSQKENLFTLLPIGLREYSLLKQIINKHKSFDILTRWKSNIEEYKKSIPNYRRRIRRKTTLISFAPPHLEIITLGAMKVKYADKWLSSSDWQTQSARDFFFLVLSHPQGLTKEEIGLILWPDDSQQELKFHFKNAIYRVRHALGKDSIILNGDHYFFNTNLDYQYDVETFRREIKHLEESKDWNRKKQLITNINALYNGKFLPEMDTDWIIQMRESLHQSYISILKFMSINAFGQEQFSDTIYYAQELLKFDSCDEEAYRISMQAQAANGNRKEVDRLYKQCEKRLLEELEAPPSQKTKKLYQSLMRI